MLAASVILLVVASAIEAQAGPQPPRPAGSSPKDTVHRYGEKIIVSQSDSVIIRVDTVWLPRKTLDLPVAAPIAPQNPPSAPVTPDSTPETILTVGGAGMFGGYTILDKEGVRISTRREHHYAVGGTALGLRHETRAWAVGVRGEWFKGKDMAGDREVVNGFRTRNAQDSSYNTTIAGVTGMLDFDTEHFGASGGIVAGDLLNNRNHGAQAQASPAFAGAIRFGWLHRIYAEASLFDHAPAAVPGPIQKFCLTQLDDAGTRYRIGVTDSGPFAEVRWLVGGWEISPFASAGENLGFNFSLGLSRRFGGR